jgi:hypothetical protein
VLGIRVEGELAPGVGGVDVALTVAGRIGRRAVPPIVEFLGRGIATLSITDRTAIASNAGALGASAVLFPSDQLAILPYNRVVKTLNGLTPEEFRARLAGLGRLQRVKDPRPEQPGSFAFFLEGAWWLLTMDQASIDRGNPIGSLDVSLLQDRVLGPILGITDPRTDKRIDFVGGVRGAAELERRVTSGEMALGISMFPTTMDQLLAVSDAGEIMPPKSTWFEPKLRRIVCSWVAEDWNSCASSRQVREDRHRQPQGTGLRVESQPDLGADTLPGALGGGSANPRRPGCARFRGALVRTSLSRSSEAGAGVDAIDVPAAQGLSIFVANCPNHCGGGPAGTPCCLPGVLDGPPIPGRTVNKGLFPKARSSHRTAEHRWAGPDRASSARTRTRMDVVA